MNNDDRLNYNKSFDINEWKKLCNDAYSKVLHSRTEFQFIDALSQLEKMKCVILSIAKVGCPECGGTGYKGYANTSTWRHSIGGNAITEDVCDVCWGTGRNDIKGIDLRKARNELINEYKEALNKI